MANERILENHATHEWHWLSAAAIERARPAPDEPQDWSGWRHVALDPRDWPEGAGGYSDAANRWGPPFPPSYMRDWGPEAGRIY